MRSAGTDAAARAFNVRFAQQQLSSATKRGMFSTLMIPSLSPFDFIGPAGSLYEVVSGIVNRCSFFKADAQQTATCKLIGAGLARAGSFASHR